MKKIFVLILLGVGLSVSSCGQKKTVSAEETKINKVCDSVLSLFKNGKYDDISNILKSNSFIDEPMIDTLQQNLAIQMQLANSNYGDLISFEFIIERKVNDFIKKRIYVLKFRKYFLKFDITLYKPESKWMITNIDCNDEVLELLY
jgi:hypothetical protein